MENNISLRPNPATISYLTHFQMAQINLNLFIREERLLKRKRKNKNTRPRL
jgi:hypothetical protein